MNIINNIFDFFLNNIFHITGDLGLAIVILTIIVKILLLPLSMKQKISLVNQQKLANKIDDIKNKYKNNKTKLNEELEKQYVENSKGILGIFLNFLQLPIIYSLYSVIIHMPFQAATILIPWATSLKVTDKYFIIPLVYTLSVITPNFLPAASYLKSFKQAKASKTSMILNSIIGSFISLIITIKAPIALGLYFITSSIFALFEEILFRVYMRNKVIN